MPPDRSDELTVLHGQDTYGSVRDPKMDASPPRPEEPEARFGAEPPFSSAPLRLVELMLGWCSEMSASRESRVCGGSSKSRRAAEVAAWFRTVQTTPTQ